MNLLTIPFHDWRKIVQEGARTRDAHLITEFEKKSEIRKIVVVNRPTTLLEIIVKRQKVKIEGKVVLSKNGFKLIAVSDRLYVLDYISYDYLGLLRKRIKWIFDKFATQSFVDFYKDALVYLDINNPIFITNNVFSAKFCAKVNSGRYIFDAYDNLVLFPKYEKIRLDIEALYTLFKNDPNCYWVTNSKTNKIYYSNNYQKIEVPVIPNAVDTDLLSSSYEIPKDLKKIPKPWVGFGGKITHLIDIELFKYVIDDNPNFSFVIVGKVLDFDVFKAITKMPNVYFLGDKHYDQYVSYATNFDVAVIPYVTGQKDTGANTIKAYEFLAARVPVIGTIGNGLQDLEKYVYLAENKEMFSELVRSVNKPKSTEMLPELYTWKSSAEKFLTILQNS